MIKKLKPKSEFSRNVLTLMTGTTIAQAIPIAISPILTRIYTPEDFGLFALYMSIVSIISVIATGRYELAIMLPRKNDDAKHLVILSLILSLFTSLIVFLIILVFNTEITQLIGPESISGWLYLIPISIAFTGIYQSLNYWLNRQKAYKTLAKSRVVQNTTMGIGNILIGLLSKGISGLIIGAVLGQLSSIYLLGRKIIKLDKTFFHHISKFKLIALAKKYIKFPKYDIFASFSNIAAQQLPHILFNILFSPSIAGFFYLTQRMMSMPINLISGAVLDVFKEQASKDYKENGHAREIYKSTFKKLLFLSIIPSVIIYIYSVDIFVIVFGEQWKIAGEYAQVLVPMLFLRFISNPLSFMFYIGEKQPLNLLLQFTTLIAVSIIFYISDSPNDIVFYLSMVFSCFYMCQLFISAYIAKIFTKVTYL